MPTFGDKIVDAMALVTESNADFQTYIRGLAQFCEEMHFYARDTEDGQVGWSVILDLERIPAEGLPWLAQFLGVRTVEGLSDADQREWIAAARSKTKGTPASIVNAAKIHLTGSKAVILRERQGGAYQLTVITRTSETPTPATTLVDIMAVKPGGLILTYSVLAGNDYQLIFANNATYAILFAKYTTYQGMLNDVPGT